MPKKKKNRKKVNSLIPQRQYSDCSFENLHWKKVIHTKSLNRRGKLINNGDETQQNMYTKIYTTPVKALPLGFLFPEENKWIFKIL